MTTDGPDLRSVVATSRDTADFCFDEDVTRLEPTPVFRIVGFDSEYGWESSSAEEGIEDERCVEVGFDVDIDGDIRDATVGWAEQGAVLDGTDIDNPEGAVALTGSTLEGGAGRTTAPNLLSFDPGGTAITFEFDQRLDCSQLTDSTSTTDDPDAENFGYYDASGNAHYGDDVESCDDTEFEVTFTSDVATAAHDDDPDDAERVFHAPSVNAGVSRDEVEPDAVNPSGQVCQPDSDMHIGACTGFETVGDAIGNKPDLTRVEETDEEEWTYSFDEDIDTAEITPSFMHLYEEDGSTHEPQTCVEEGDSEARCTFDDPGLDEASDTEFPMASAEVCAVEDAVTENLCNAYGVFALADCDRTAISSCTSHAQIGTTDAPDLERIRFDPALEEVEFCFDEDVDEDSPSDTAFYLIGPDGNHSAKAGADDVDDVNDDCVLVDFDEAEMADAVGAGVETGAVEDWLGNESIPATVGPLTQTFSTTATANTTSSTTVTPTHATTTSPAVRRVESSLTIRYLRRSYVYVGAVSSQAGGCRRGRLITLKRRRSGSDRTIGSDSSTPDGLWSVRKRARRGAYYAVAARKTFTGPRGGKIVCLSERSRTVRV